MSETTTATHKLQERIDHHRNVEERGITCRTNCWCWDAEALLLALEAEPDTLLALLADAVKALDDIIKEHEDTGFSWADVKGQAIPSYEVNRDEMRDLAVYRAARVAAEIRRVTGDK